MMNKKQLTLTTAMAATLGSLSGCAASDDWDGNVVADRDTAVCVNQSGVRVEDARCGTTSRGHVGGHGWYYVNRGSPLPYHGDSVNDSRLGIKGSPTPKSGGVYSTAPGSTSMTRSAAIARGGFGSSGRSFGGGRS